MTTTTTETDVRLRAAHLIEQRANTATQGHWTHMSDELISVDQPQDSSDFATGWNILIESAEHSDADAAHIAGIADPNVGRAIALLLKRVVLLEQCPPVDWMDKNGRVVPRLDDRILGPIEDIARAYLREGGAAR